MKHKDRVALEIVKLSEGSYIQPIWTWLLTCEFQCIMVQWISTPHHESSTFGETKLSYLYRKNSFLFHSTSLAGVSVFL